MSSPCLSGSRTYRLDLEIVKSPSTSTITSQTSSPSSTLSEFSNSPLAISPRKPRTPRKRPNQTYNEAAALLSTAYPNIFSAKHLTNPSKFYKPHESALLLDESSELLLPCRVFDNSGFLLHQPVRDVPAGFFNEPKFSSLMSPSDKSCQSSNSTTAATTWEVDSMEVCDGYREEVDFDAESILDEEIEEGIDSIMGNPSDSNEILFESKNNSTVGGGSGVVNPCLGNHMGWFNLGGGFQFGFGVVGMRRGVSALRRVPDGSWPTFPVVDMFQISPRLNANGSSNSNSNPNSNTKPKLKLSLPNSNSGDKKKKKKVEKPVMESKISGMVKENSVPEVANSGLLLKLNYDDVLEAWSGRGLPFPEEILEAEGNDASARWAQIDLFSESGGGGGLLREASVLRYKEKRRTRLFSKKIRYQVRKVNADRRPRMKGRFVRRPNSSGSHQRRQD